MVCGSSIFFIYYPHIFFTIIAYNVPTAHTPDYLFSKYDSFKVSSFSKRHFPPETLYAVLARLAANSNGLIAMLQRGESFEKRPIYLLKAGTGSIKILLWSQMHGDESTATMAICDILKYLIMSNKEPATHEMLSRISLYFVPMLNPDGAARIQRRTAQLIDMNRDAMALRTPEARLLKELQHELKPEFGFNLHDQELSTVGNRKELTALALLAPASDVEKNTDNVRLRAKRLAAFIADVVSPFTGGRLARYDDSFEPRAYGDNMQMWGTSTVLIESGHAQGDPEKESIRRLNAVALLSCFEAIADGSYQQSNPDRYETLSFNGKRALDTIVRNVLIVHENGAETKADLGISRQVDTHTEDPPRLVEIGDLSTFLGLEEIDGGMKKIPEGELAIGKEFRFTPQ